MTQPWEETVIALAAVMAAWKNYKPQHKTIEPEAREFFAAMENLEQKVDADMARLKAGGV